MKGKIELLSPAGDMSAFISAINNGADAIYLSGNKFGARAYATNFSLEDIIECIRIAHLLNVKIYVTVNTLIKDDEFNECINFVHSLYQNNVDGVLIQDIGLAYTLSKIMPSLPLHASTQMNVHSVSEALKLKEMGFKRIVLGRECDIDTIKKIKENVDIELEVFGHGALCMSYSGECLMSSFIGKRSGNRGRCAGACRLKYQLVKNNDMLSSNKYYLSLKDLYTLDKINELVDANIDSIKLEGRVKKSEYVSLITKTYREAIDAYYLNTKFDIDKRTYELKEMFNRGFTKGHLFKEKNSQLTNIISPNHIGVSVGKVINVIKSNFSNKINNYAYIEMSFSNKDDYLAIGDSIRIIDNSNELEDGITLSRMSLCEYKNGNLKTKKDVSKAYDKDIICIITHKPLSIGMDVLKTQTISLINDNSLNKEIIKKTKISGYLYEEENHLALELNYNYDDINVNVKEISVDSVDVVKNIESLNRIKDQISKISNTLFEFSDLKCDLSKLFFPIKEINELRRKAIASLEDAIINAKSYNHDVLKFKRQALNISNDDAKLIVKVRTKEQLKACKDLKINTIISEEDTLKDEDILFINPRLASVDRGISENKEFSSVYKNIFNAYALYYMHLQGIKTVGLSVELSKSEIEALIYNYKQLFKEDANVMMMVYGYNEVMITKHCLINKFNENNDCFDKKYCMECIRNQYYLKDKLDYKFALIRDNYCNLKVLNSMRLNLIKYLHDIVDMGVNTLLLDFTIEDYDETYDVLSNFINSFNGSEYKRDFINSTYGHFKEGIE